MSTNLYTFYENVLNDELRFYSYDEDYMESAMDILLASYSVSGLDIPDSVDFDRKDLRCAYLHLFATSHSHMVLEAFKRLNQLHCSYLLNLVCEAWITDDSFNVTSLGGGPGSDPMGVLLFLKRAGYLEGCPWIKVHLIDEYRGWEEIFNRVLLKFADHPVSGQFIAQDLLEPLSNEVEVILQQTHLLTMTKFISAISGDKTGVIFSLTRIFHHLRPGALILIIDNAGGNDFKQALAYALTLGLETVMEPIQHYDFKVPKNLEPRIGKMKYGKRPQTCSRISIVFLKKPQRQSSLRAQDTIRTNINSTQHVDSRARHTRAAGRLPVTESYPTGSSVVSRLALYSTESFNNSTNQQQPRTPVPARPTQVRPLTTHTTSSNYTYASDPRIQVRGQAGHVISPSYMHTSNAQAHALTAQSNYLSYPQYVSRPPQSAAYYSQSRREIRRDEGWSCCIL